MLNLLCEGCGETFECEYDECPECGGNLAELVICPACSEAGGAGRAVWHIAPICTTRAKETTNAYRRDKPN